MGHLLQQSLTSWHQGPISRRQFFHGQGVEGVGGDGLGVIQAHYHIVHFISIIITSVPPQIIRH